MYYKCCLCNASRQDAILYHFPCTEKRRQVWLECLPSSRGDLKALTQVQLSKLFVCSRHFEERFVTQKSRLVGSAYPTLFSAEEITKGIPSQNENVDPQADHIYCRKRHFDHTYAKRKPLTDVPLHIFPNPIKFPDRFKTWVNLVGGKLEAPSDYEFYKKQRLCDIHFSIEQKNRFKRLNALAVPSLHLPDNRSVSRENQGLQEAAPSTVNEELDTSATAEVQQSLDKSPGPVEEEADNKVAGEVQGLQETSSPGPVDEEPDAPVEVKEVCRICLAFNVKMFNIQEHNLCQMLYDITGIEVGENDGIFQYVCYECAARLSAASAFRHKALQSDGMLQRLMNCGDTIAEQITFLKENLEILKPTLTVQEVFITTDIAEEPNIKLNLIDDKTVETTKPVIIHEKYKDIVKTFCDVETIDNFVPAERSLTMNEDGSVTICENIKEHESTTLHGVEDNCNAITKEELTRRVRERLQELKCCNVPDLVKEFGVTTELVQKIIDDAGLKKGYKRKKDSPQNQRGAGKKSKVS
ncbi:uncharacterized protein LOC124644475 isoform X11 [Helicoverpa zea]|uniref:uncharacterized protein LOC124644475 isoform X11 n=1 Tax=Helicoverpa zea TaxID=7113 RepID=UPI001F577DC4|nr:uncharacterized protein LOC124644475 isoform X11 [Helicoverpa zea]